MKSFAAQVAIRSTPERIWQILTNSQAYTRWNSTVQRVEGMIAARQKVTVYPKANPGRAFPIRVRVFEPNQRMIWVGGMPLGMFTGTRTFELIARSSGETEFRLREEYTGWMAPLISGSIPDLQPAFDAFAQDLKKASEANEIPMKGTDSNVRT